MEKAAFMDLAESRGGADCEPQEMFNLHGRGQQIDEWLAAGIFKQQYCSPAIALQLKWSHSPAAIQLLSKAKLVRETIKAGA
jgi:hypothetical protein